jgi:Fe2+ transport system protein FeoA
MHARTLAQASPGRRVKLVSIRGDRALSRRLLALGLTVGNEVEVLHSRRGDVIVGRDGNRLALGHDIAEQVVIEEVE